MKSHAHIYACLCTYCGSAYELYHDTETEEFICKECLDKEEEESDEEEDNYPLDMNHSEFKREINK